ncbi:hypothetical protein Tco_0420756 [Tanacetum coccineum]
MEQYLALTRGNQAPGVVKPKIGGNVNFEIKSQFMRELREDTFSRNKNDDAHEHVERVLDIVILFNTPGAEGDETLYQAWERYNDVLYKWPTHDINIHQKVNIFYNGIGTMNHQLLDSQGPIPGMTPAQALTAIQTMADHSQKWHDGSSNRKIKRAHLDKDCPLNEQVKSVEEAKYGEFRDSSPFSNGAKYRVGPPGYYIHIDNRPSLREKRPSLEELMNKHLEESMRRRAEMEEWMKKLQENVDINTRNQSVSLKKFGDPNRAANKGKTDMLVEMAYMMKRSPIGIVEKVLVKIDKFLFPSAFEVMDMLNTRNETMILRRPYLATIHAKIDVFNKEISLGIGGDRVTFDMNKKIHNFKTHVGNIYMINSIHNEESPSLSSTPSDKSSRFKKSDNNYDNHIQEQRSKKTRSIKGGGLSFPEFLLVKYREGQKKELIWDNKYEEWCTKNSSPDTPTSKLASVQEDYKPRPKDYSFKDWLLTKVGHTKWKKDPQKDVERLESNLKTRFYLYGSRIRGLLDSFSCGIKVLSGRN